MPLRPLPPPDVWLDARLVERDSAIDGRGLFFSEDLPAGVVVIRLGGRLVSSRELDSLMAVADADPDAAFVDTVTVFDDAHLVMPPTTLVHFGNHSCDPTLWHVGPYEISTRRAVVAGEEATIDYGTQSGAEGFEMPCSCGASNCRGRVTSDDWRDATLQSEYAGHWVPALQQLIDAM